MAELPFKVAHLSELPQFTDPDGAELTYDFRMVRRPLGVGSFGINAMQALNAGGVVVSEHVELDEGGRHEELYYVARGAARFTIDGESVDAREGTFVFVPDPASSRARGRRGGRHGCSGHRRGAWRRVHAVDLGSGLVEWLAVDPRGSSVRSSSSGPAASPSISGARSSRTVSSSFRRCAWTRTDAPSS